MAKIRRPFNTRTERESYLGFAPIVTKRLVVRTLRASDAPSLSHFLRETDFKFPRYIGWPIHDEIKALWTVQNCRIKMVNHFRRNIPRQVGSIDLFIFRSGSQDIIGHITFYHDRIGNPRTAYFLSTEATGHGYAAEAVSALQKRIFDHERHKIHFAEANTDNSKSIAVLRRIGFTRLGRADALNRHPLYQDNNLRFRITRRELRI
jgi:aminoglycoside 6'-N-acetyltransferase